MVIWNGNGPVLSYLCTIIILVFGLSLFSVSLKMTLLSLYVFDTSYTLFMYVWSFAINPLLEGRAGWLIRLMVPQQHPTIEAFFRTCPSLPTQRVLPPFILHSLSGGPYWHTAVPIPEVLTPVFRWGKTHGKRLCHSFIYFMSCLLRVWRARGVQQLLKGVAVFGEE